MQGIDRRWLNYDYTGWLSVPVAGLGVVYFKATEVEGRWRVTELYVDGEGKPLQAAALRALPLSALEEEAQEVAAFSTRAHARSPEVVPAYGEGGPDLGALLASLAPENASYFLTDGERVTGGGVGIPRDELEPMTLDYDPGASLSDDFLQSVARVYSWSVRERRPPAKEIAAQAGVSQRTAQSWIYKARKRGLMPPAPHRGRIA